MLVMQNPLNFFNFIENIVYMNKAHDSSSAFQACAFDICEIQLSKYSG